MLLSRMPQAANDDVFADEATLATPIEAAATHARQHAVIPAQRTDAPVVEVEPVHCKRCGRTLRSASSRAVGYGPTCARKVRAAMTQIAEGFKPHQIASATQLIEDGGLVGGAGEFVAVSSDGLATYVVNAYRQTCTCKAGQNGRRCYHLAAALAVAA